MLSTNDNQQLHNNKALIKTICSTGQALNCPFQLYAQCQDNILVVPKTNEAISGCDCTFS
jgi:hypothetical protein